MKIYKAVNPRWVYFTDIMTHVTTRILRDMLPVVVADIGFPEGCTRKWALGGDDYIQLKFSLDSPKDIGVGDFAVYNGQSYACTERYIPTYNQNTGGYDYDVKFEAFYKLLGLKTAMLTTLENAEYNRRSSKWQLTDSLYNHLNIINTNIKALEIFMPVGEPNEDIFGNISYPASKLKVPSVVISNVEDFKKPDGSRLCDEHKFVTYDGIDILTAINTLCSEENYNCEWWYDETSHTIKLGKCGGIKSYEEKEKERGTIIASPRGIGGDKEAEKISVNKSEKEYFTRLRLYGSTRNIPDIIPKAVVLKYSPNNYPFVDKEGKVIQTDVTMFKGEQVKETLGLIEQGTDEPLNMVYANIGELDATVIKNPLQKPITRTVSEYIYSSSFEIACARPCMATFTLSFIDVGKITIGQYSKEPAYITAKLQYKNGNKDWVDVGEEKYFGILRHPDRPVTDYKNWDGKLTKTYNLTTPSDAILHEVRVAARIVSMSQAYLDMKVESLKFKLSGERTDIKRAEVTMQALDEENKRKDIYWNFIIEGTMLSATKKTDVEWSWEGDAPAKGTRMTPLEKNDSNKDWTSDIYEKLYAVTDVGAQVSEKRLNMLDENGGRVEYVDAEGFSNLPQTSIVEKVDVDDDIYPCVTMENNIVMSNPYSKRTKTLLEYKLGRERQSSDGKNYMFKVETQYNDGSKQDEYYEYFVLGDANTGILDNTSGITKDWLIQGETLRVHFNTGRLAGMEFEATIEKDNGKDRVICIIPNDTYGKMLPNGSLIPFGPNEETGAKGDEYVLIGWDPYRIKSTDVVTKAGNDLLKEAQERVNDAVRDHNTYQVRMMCDNAANKAFYGFYTNDGRKFVTADGDEFRTADEQWVTSRIFNKGEGVRLSDEGIFPNNVMVGEELLEHTSSLLRVVGFEHPLDYPYDGMTYTIGETPVLKGTLNTIKKQLKS